MTGARRRLLLRRLGAALAVAGGAPPFAGARTKEPNGNEATGTDGKGIAAYPDVVRGQPLEFPRDHGAHEAYRTEWWYATGWLRRTAGPHRGEPAGVQITFFRTRTRHDTANPSRFAPLQLLFAHVALALPERASLLHAQRAAREGLGLAQASRADTDVAIGDWSFARGNDDVYRTRIADASLAIALSFQARAAPVPQGDAGFSRKGPRETQASWYYSRPQLELRGTIGDGRRDDPVEGVAWLDHEWSSEILDPSADGWDWVGLNFDDGSALMAFRIRARAGGTLWSDAKRIDAGRTGAPAGGTPPGTPARPEPHAGAGKSAPAKPRVRFEPLRHWTSPRTGVRYPVEMRLSVDERSYTLEPLFDDQELDTRVSTGVIYWEGAVRVLENGGQVGRGYLELTGYEARVRF